MNYLIVSDTHLRKEFDRKKFLFLKKLFEKYQNIIIVGDFYEGYSLTFKDLLKGPWKKILDILKKKNSIYLYGNHDYYNKKNELLIKKIFKIYQEDFSINIGKKTFYFHHGFKFLKTIDIKFKFYLLPKFITDFMINKINYYQKHKIRAIQYKKNLNKIFLEKDTLKSIKKIKEIFSKRNFWVIFGHTHNRMIDYKEKIANAGFIDYGYASFLTISKTGKIKLHQKTY